MREEQPRHTSSPAENPGLLTAYSLPKPGLVTHGHSNLASSREFPPKLNRVFLGWLRVIAPLMGGGCSGAGVGHRGWGLRLISWSRHAHF